MDNHVDLVFDGYCGFCTRAAYWIERMDRCRRVRLHPAQRPGVRERFGLTRHDTATAAWAFDGDRVASGAGAVSIALDAALGIRFFYPLHNLLGVRWIQEHVYCWVAEHRYLLHGVTPWCAAHPEDCEPDDESAC